MRLSELLRSRVIDSEGEDLGRVHDVRFVDDGPLLGDFGSALRVDGLIVGGGSLGIRLGFHRSKVKGPWPLKALLEAATRRSRYITWEDVEACEENVVRLSVAGANLPRFGEAGFPSPPP